MIKANELRIGNWLSVNEDGPDVNKQIIYIGKDCKGFDGYFLNFGAMSVSLEGREDNVTPIELTPEILEKCGILPTEPKGWYSITPKKGSQTMMFFWPDFYYLHYADGGQCPDIQYLHQLQNLYFALTGEELKITL